MSKLYFGIPADPCLHSISCCPSQATSRPTTDAWLYHIGQPEGFYAESAVDGSRTPRPSVAQQSPLPSFDSGMHLPFLIPSPSPPPSLPSISSLRLPLPSRTSLSSRPPPRCDANLCCADISPRTHNKGGVDSREGINSSDPNDISSKRRRLSESLGGMPALSSHNEPRRFCPPPIVKATKYDESKRSSVDKNLASTARSSPVTFESASPTAPELSSIDDASKEWEVRQIIGKEYVDGMLHYLVEWCPTLEPQHSLGHAKEMVDKFEAQLRAYRWPKSGREGLGLKVKKQAAVGADASGGQQQKERRGRPRKQK